MCLHTLPATASASRRYMDFPFSKLKNSSLVGQSCSGANLTELWEEVCQIQCEQLLFSNLYSNFGKPGRVKNPLATCLWAASMSPWTHIAMCLRMFVCHRQATAAPVKDALGPTPKIRLPHILISSGSHGRLAYDMWHAPKWHALFEGQILTLLSCDVMRWELLGTRLGTD